MNQPKSPSAKPKRSSILEAHGFELTKVKARYVMENKFQVKTQSPGKRTKTRRLSLPIHSESEKEIKNFLEFNKNSQGKVLAKNFFEFVSEVFLTKDQTLNFFNLLKGKMFKELPHKELRDLLKKAKTIEPESQEKNLFDSGKLKELFLKYDLDADGFLSLVELKKALRDKFSSQTIETLFHEYDQDSDGRLDFEDFVKLCMPGAG
jgi:Ca2+-binding EF-hand superfamily protein